MWGHFSPTKTSHLSEGGVGVGTQGMSLQCFLFRAHWKFLIYQEFLDSLDLFLWLPNCYLWWVGTNSMKYVWKQYFTYTASFKKVLFFYICYSTVTCKVLLNWPHSKFGQHLADSLPNFGLFHQFLQYFIQ